MTTNYNEREERTMTTNHDEKCYQLAEYFLPKGNPADLKVMAEAIQLAVEDNMPEEDCDCPCDICAIGTGKHCGKKPCDQKEKKR
jgi:hypothetical protein